MCLIGFSNLALVAMRLTKANKKEQKPKFRLENGLLKDALREHNLPGILLFDDTGNQEITNCN